MPQPSQHSITLLSHLRWISAFTVVLSHVSQDFLAKPHYIAHINASPGVLVKKALFRSEGYGHAAVVVFFVLSGFLVGGKLIELLKSDDVKNDWQRFLVDRVVRIFVVLWPAVIISAIVCFALVHFLPDAPFVAHGGWSYSLSAPLTGDQNLAKWVSVTTLLNEIVMPTITTNGPLWSLAYEWSYYVVALAAVLSYRTYFSVGSVVIILYGLVLLLAAAHNQPDILFAGISWVAGAFARAAYNRDMLHGRATQIIGITLVVAVLIKDHRHPLPDPVLGIALAVMLAHSSWKSWTFGAHISERLASFSYSLYLIHFPALLGVLGVLYASGRVTHPLKFGGQAVIIIGAATLFVVLVACVFAWFTEDRTVVIRRSILNLIGTSHSKLRAPVIAATEITAKD